MNSEVLASSREANKNQISFSSENKVSLYKKGNIAYMRVECKRNVIQ